MTYDNPSRDRIVREARRHFLTHGFRGVTMDDLSTELGMSKKTLYASFSSKKELVKAAIDNKLGEVQIDLEQISSDVSLDFFAVTSRLLGCLRGHWDELQPPFFRDLSRETPELATSVQERKRWMIETYIGKILRKGRETGAVRSDIPLELMLEMLIAATDGMMHPQKLAALNIPFMECQSAIVTIFLEGVISNRERPYFTLRHDP